MNPGSEIALLEQKIGSLEHDIEWITGQYTKLDNTRTNILIMLAISLLINVLLLGGIVFYILGGV